MVPAGAPAAYYTNQPPSAIAVPTAPSNRGAILRRIGEAALVVVVMGLYALYNWQEVVNGFRTFLQSLKPPT